MRTPTGTRIVCYHTGVIHKAMGQMPFGGTTARRLYEEILRR
jgi:hypothetical protein